MQNRKAGGRRMKAGAPENGSTVPRTVADLGPVAPPRSSIARFGLAVVLSKEAVGNDAGQKEAPRVHNGTLPSAPPPSFFCLDSSGFGNTTPSLL
ncbi:hypothetical protein GGTG_03046 [Gaeumannomyces tritici R3-111a-1]|uniref:Uncharacterized protein n=1 Tax=Gaeumannomyces tritici (strain R3-111a-1) TaxID=644352 RepID=J3NP40_GAET3|nr:hypothetical protein GGTG_03046 [Gaeumannomyces tritici R3-111a-1]EJT77943.1 hypothetical protein GGTG_03046 [Gaeumannomyces tritici R3-111a-1]